MADLQSEPAVLRQTDRHGGTTLTVRDAGAVTADELVRLAGEAAKAALARGGAAVFVRFPYPDAGGFGVALDRAGFKFRQVTTAGGMAEHYRWQHQDPARGDPVPSPHHYIAGASVAVCTRDNHTLFVVERRGGAAKFVSGAVDTFEVPAGTGARELLEEVGLDLGAAFGAAEPAFRVLGGYFKSHCNPDGDGDSHVCLFVRLPARIEAGTRRLVLDDGTRLPELRLQEAEIRSAEWVPEGELRRRVEAGEAAIQAGERPKDIRRGVVRWARTLLDALNEGREPGLAVSRRRKDDAESMAF